VPAAGADIRRFSSDRSGGVIDAPLLAIAAAASAFAEALLFPALVLPVVVAQLTPDRTLVGFAAAVPAAVWTLARLLTGLLLHRRTRLKPVAAAGAILRVVALLLIVRAALDPAVTRDSLLRALLFGVILAAIANATSQTAARALMPRVVVADSQRGLLTVRAAAGGVAALLAGAIVASAFAPAGPGFARGLGLVALLAAFAAGLGALALILVREPSRLAPYRLTPPADALDGALAALRHRDVRRFALVRLPLAAAAAADPFLLLYAGERLAVPLRFAGLALVAFAAGRFIGRLLLHRIETARGPRVALQAVAAIRVAVPALTLGIALVGSAGSRGAWAALLVPFALLGAAWAGQTAASFSYLQTLGDPALRRNASTLLDALLAILAFGPIVAGTFASSSGVQPLLVIAMLCALAALFAASLLTDPRPAVRRPRGARSATPRSRARR
jgi:hypothetical protein